MRSEWPVEKMLWVLTYQIGTNENRRSRTINFSSLEMAEKSQEVLGGTIEEYIATSRVRARLEVSGQQEWGVFEVDIPHHRVK